MLRVYQVTLSLDEDLSVIPSKLAKILGVKEKEILSYQVYKETLDARKRHMCFAYTIDCTLKNETKVLRKKLKQVSVVEPMDYVVDTSGVIGLKHRIVVVGYGPAGMFASYLLAKYGYKPIVIERGACVKQRSEDVLKFWNEGILNEESNVQYGEGGAGTFSDGKLTSRSKDPRIHQVLETLVECGAPKEILYEAYPHIGTDILKDVVVNLREKMLEMGGEIHFHSKLNDLKIEEGRIKAIKVNDSWMACDVLVLAIGNSARDTIQLLHSKNISMSAKDFALGIRIEHPQSLINKAQYHEYVDHPRLKQASYALKMTSDYKRGVYSFCMCPGGHVVASTSKKERVVVNGMSYHARNHENGNSALLVQMFAKEFNDDYMQAMNFIDEMEHKAYLMGKDYQAPAQLVKDFLNERSSSQIGSVTPTYQRGIHLCNLHDLLPYEIAQSLKQAIVYFDQKFENFALDDAIMSAIETRSSSPVRINRNQDLESTNTIGIYPCGEGAGYAGGIVSSAIDGLKVAEMIMKTYCMVE